MSKRSYRKSEDESSLELLLDTMCNTFGGVMFIAISIFVIISGMTQIDNALEQQNTDPEELRRNITELQSVLQQAMHQLDIQTEELKIRQKESDSPLMQETVQLEQLLKELDLKKQSTLLAVTGADKSLQQATAQQLKLQEQLKALAAENSAEEIQLMELTQKLKNLQYQQIPAQQMVFKVMQSSEKHPFFIVMQNGKVWPVGPWKTPDGDTPDAAVITEKIAQDNIQIYRFKVKPDTGIEVLAGDDLSSQFVKLLKKIPADRVPKFFIPPASAETAFKMREILKKQNIQHGLTLAPDDSTPLSYQYYSEVKYEY
ncbi:MAG: hypothetical protein E7056_03090 [Lentisphaerae bacterium]|nr:hypothetical protein [Lentisphaerota bacterium]